LKRVTDKYTCICSNLLITGSVTSAVHHFDKISQKFGLHGLWVTVSIIIVYISRICSGKSSYIHIKTFLSLSIAN